MNDAIPNVPVWRELETERTARIRREYADPCDHGIPPRAFCRVCDHPDLETIKRRLPPECSDCGTRGLGHWPGCTGGET